MKILKILLFQFLILSACSANNINAYKSASFANAPASIKTLIKSIDKKCYTLYNTTQVWILEQHCSKKQTEQGIYIVDGTGLRKFDLFDSHFNDWAWQEGCNSEKDCYYKITTNSNGKVSDLVYFFFINLSEGFYKLTIKNNKLIISEKKIIDHPS